LEQHHHKSVHIELNATDAVVSDMNTLMMSYFLVGDMQNLGIPKRFHSLCRCFVDEKVSQGKIPLCDIYNATTDLKDVAANLSVVI
jgi:hypothetical protein